MDDDLAFCLNQLVDEQDDERKKVVEQRFSKIEEGMHCIRAELDRENPQFSEINHHLAELSKLAEIMHDMMGPQESPSKELREIQSQCSSRFQHDIVDQLWRHIRQNFDNCMEFVASELMSFLQESTKDLTKAKPHLQKDIIAVLNHWREQQSQSKEIQLRIDQIVVLIRCIRDWKAVNIIENLRYRTALYELDELQSHLIWLVDAAKIHFDKEELVDRFKGIKKLLNDLIELMNQAKQHLRHCLEQLQRACGESHRKVLSQCERESMQLLSVLQVMAVGSSNAGEFDRRRKLAEQNVLNELQRSPTSKTPVIDGYIDDLSSNPLSMALSFWNDDNIMKPEEWNSTNYTIKRGFCSQICGHYGITQSNKFEVIQVVQEKDDNNKNIFVVHTLVHPPHAEKVTKELMTDDKRTASLVQKVESLLMHSIRLFTLGHFGMEVINPKWNRVYTDALGQPDGTFWSGYIDRGGKPYFCPKGWKRYALKVADNEAEFDRRWGTWHIAYHGTKGEHVGAILQSGLKVSTHGCYLKRPSVYLSPSIEYCAHPRYSRIWQKPGVDGKYYQLVFQCRVNPRVVSKSNVHQETLLNGRTIKIDPNFTNTELEWVIPAVNNNDEYITEDIICYGIMVRSSDEHPKKLPSSHWWSVTYYGERE